MKKNDHDKELKELSQAIVEALTHNGDVMALLSDLKERGVIDSATMLGLALKVSDLLEISGIAFTQDDVQTRQQAAEEDLPTEEESFSDDDTRTGVELDAATEAQMIDGRNLSKSETAFQEWSADHFDEKKWLKESGLIW